MNDIPTFDARDFGAVGHSLADDTEAIQATFNAVRATGGVVRLPQYLPIKSSRRRWYEFWKRP